MKSIFNYFRTFSFKKLLYLSVLAFTFIYVFSVPTFGEKTGWQRYIIYASMLFITFSVALYTFLYGKFAVAKSTLLIPAFAIFSFIGTVLYSHEFRSWASLLLLVISFYSFLYSFKIIKNKYLVISIISFAFFAFGLFYILHYREDYMHISSVLSGKRRLGSDFDNPNGVAAYAIVSFATSFYLILFLKKKWRFIFILPTLVSVLVGISTGSRTFYLMVLVVAALFFFYFFEKHRLVYLIVLASMIVLGVIVLNLPVLSFLKERLLVSIQTLFGTAMKADTSTVQRVNYIEYGFYLGAKNLFIGYGVKGFGVVSGINTYSHCNFAEVLCDFGIIGFVLFYSPLVLLLLKAIYDRRIDKGFIVSFFVYYFIVSFTNVLYYKKIYYLVLAFMFYLVYYDRDEKKVKLCANLRKIVFTCDTISGGGAEKVIATLSNSFVEKNIEVTIIGVSDGGNNNSFYTLNDKISYIPLCSTHNKKVKILKRIFFLRNELARIQPDIVISFLPHVNFYTMVSCKLLKIPYIVSERNDPKRNPKKFIYRIFKYLSFMNADGCVFQNNGAKNYYYSAIREKSVIINNPLSLKYIPTKCANKKEKVVLAVGRLEEQKNYKSLLKAFKLFNEKVNYSYKLRIYGNGSLAEELKDFVEHLQITEYVEFVGVAEDWHKKEYNDAMYILSSDYEGMPNSLIEAMALGIPSISTDCPCGSPREIIENGVNGFLVPVNNPITLSEKMAEIIKIPADRFYNATRTILTDYSTEVVSEQWLNYINGLTKRVYE